MLRGSFTLNIGAGSLSRSFSSGSSINRSANSSFLSPPSIIHTSSSGTDSSVPVRRRGRPMDLFANLRKSESTLFNVPPTPPPTRRPSTDKDDIATLENCVNIMLGRKGRGEILGAHSLSLSRGISKSTLDRHYQTAVKKGITSNYKVAHKKQGRKTLIHAVHEQKLATFCKTFEEINMPLTRKQLAKKGKEICEVAGSHTSYSSFKLSHTWIKRFAKRHDIKFKTAQPWEHARQAHTNRELIGDFIKKLGQQIDFINLNSPRAMTAKEAFNIDEVGTDRFVKERAPVATSKRAEKRRTRQLGGNYAHVTGVACINAAGDRLPLHFICKGNRVPRSNDAAKVEADPISGVRPKGTPQGTYVWMQDSGFMDDQIWNKYTDVLIRNMRATLPEEERDTMWQLLILDGFGAHTKIFSSLKKFRDYKIIVLSLPSHTSADMQPLDVAVFKAFKEWVSTHYDAKNLERFQESLISLDQWEIPRIMALAWKEAASVENVKSAFKAPGIWPYNPKFVEENDELFKAGDVYYKADPEKMIQSSSSEGSDSGTEVMEDEEVEEESDFYEVTVDDVLATLSDDEQPAKKRVKLLKVDAGKATDLGNAVLTDPNLEPALKEAAKVMCERLSIGKKAKNLRGAVEELLVGALGIHTDVDYTFRLESGSNFTSLKDAYVGKNVERKKKKLNFLGEPHANSNVLNDPDRLERLREYEEGKAATDNENEAKKRQVLDDAREQFPILKVAYEKKLINFDPREVVSKTLTQKLKGELFNRLNPSKDARKQFKKLTGKAFAKHEASQQVHYLQFNVEAIRDDTQGTVPEAMITMHSEDAVSPRMRNRQRSSNMSDSDEDAAVGDGSEDEEEEVDGEPGRETRVCRGRQPKEYVTSDSEQGDDEGGFKVGDRVSAHLTVPHKTMKSISLLYFGTVLKTHKKRLRIVFDDIMFKHLQKNGSGKRVENYRRMKRGQVSLATDDAPFAKEQRFVALYRGFEAGFHPEEQAWEAGVIDDVKKDGYGNSIYDLRYDDGCIERGVYPQYMKTVAKTVVPDSDGVQQ